MNIRLRSRDDILFQILVNGFLLSILIAVIVPIWRVLMMSITPLNYMDSKLLGLWVGPGDWSFEAYRQLLTHPNFLRAATNSLIIMVSGTTINLLLTVPLAYALSNKRLPGRKLIISFILIPYLFRAGLIPNYLVVQKLGLVDSFLAVILPTGISVLYTLIMKNYFEGLPEEFKEAARLDGASEFHVLLRVILPLSKPILLTIGLFYAVAHWNEFFAAILYLNDPKLAPLPVLLRNILLAANINEYVEYNAFSSAPVQAIKAASVFITMLPMVLIYPWMQRHFTKGTLVGGVKE
jgi:putative aldouronate transport system permease protein